MKRAIRHGFGLSMALALVLALAAPVAAAKPDRAFSPAEDFLISGYCDFDVQVEIVANNAYGTTFFDRAGNVTRTHYAGRIVLRMTNAVNGTSIIVNASGPGTYLEDADGLTVLTGGTWMLWFDGQLFTLSGRGEFRIDANGETIVSLRGHVVELCPILAG